MRIKSRCWVGYRDDLQSLVLWAGFFLALNFIGPPYVNANEMAVKQEAEKVVSSEAWKKDPQIAKIIETSEQTTKAIDSHELSCASSTWKHSCMESRIKTFIDQKGAILRVTLREKDTSGESEGGPRDLLLDYDPNGTLRYGRQTEAGLYETHNIEVFLGENGRKLIVSEKLNFSVDKQFMYCVGFFDNEGKLIKTLRVGDYNGGGVCGQDFPEAKLLRPLLPSEFIAREKTIAIANTKKAEAWEKKERALNEERNREANQRPNLDPRSTTPSANREFPKAPAFWGGCIALMGLLLGFWNAIPVLRNSKQSRFRLAYFFGWILFLFSFVLPATHSYPSPVSYIDGIPLETNKMIGVDRNGIALVGSLLGQSVSGMVLSTGFSTRGGVRGLIGGLWLMGVSIFSLLLVLSNFLFFRSLLFWFEKRDLSEKQLSLYSYVIIAGLLAPFIGSVSAPEFLGTPAVGYFTWVSAWFFLRFSLQEKLG